MARRRIDMTGRVFGSLTARGDNLRRGQTTRCLMCLSVGRKPGSRLLSSPSIEEHW